MKNGICLVFVNCEEAFIPEDFIFSFNITSSSDKIHNMTYYKIIDNMQLIIEKEIKEYIPDRKLIFTDEMRKNLERMKRCDITQVHVYIDNNHYFYVPNYDSETEYGVNKKQSVREGDLLLTINIKK